MKMQPSDPRKASELDSLPHQSRVLCRIFFLSQCQQTFTLTASVHGGWAPCSPLHGAVFRLVVPLACPLHPEVHLVPLIWE